MPSFSVDFAYNSTESIPAVGAQRKTYNVVFANGNLSRLESERDVLIDSSRNRDVTGKTLMLKFHLGRTILQVSADRDWFRSFFQANFRWAVFGNFKDTANTNNFCLCNPEENDIEISAARDQEGYILLSDKVF